ncbi:MAG: VOC family protein [Geminicoccaceae bacterium]
MTGPSTVTATLFPAATYGDAPHAVRWLQDAFGFAEKAVYPTDDGGIGHAELSFGNGILMLGSARDEPGNPWAANPIGIYVVVDDVDAHCARARAAGAEIVIEPRDTDYGSREYSARDCEGRLWSFGTYRP